MPSFFKSNKGVETAPLVIAFSAIVILLAAAIILPELGKWNSAIDKAKTLREAKKLAAACDEVIVMGDSGSVQEVGVDVPANCCIWTQDAENILTGPGIIAQCSIPNQDYFREKIPVKGSLDDKIDDHKICGTTVKVIVAYWSGMDNSIPQGSYIIYVKK
jgi:hypothetical protein